MYFTVSMKRLFQTYANPQLLLIFSMMWDRDMKISPPIAYYMAVES